VIGLDNVASRRELGLKFGCDHVFDPSSMPEADLVKAVKALCKPEGADAVIEVCGYPEVAIPGLQMLRTGGRFVFGGTVNPGSTVSIDANMVLRKLLTIRGVHNYHPRHLIEALDFVHGNRKRFPFHALVDGKYGLAEVGRAMKDAEDRKVLRAAIVP
jgi:threonine dehydrogenase-like Zn-dependent dehydrogenase